jgi:hypothetical protein
MSARGGDHKKRAEYAALICLATPVLRVPQAMRAAGYLDDDDDDDDGEWGAMKIALTTPLPTTMTTTTMTTL